MPIFPYLSQFFVHNSTTRSWAVEKDCPSVRNSSWPFGIPCIITPEIIQRTTPGILLGILGRRVSPGSPNLDPYSDQKCHFPHPFSDQISKIYACFQTWPLGRNYVIITKIRAQTKKFFKCILNSHISVSFLFIWN